MPMKIAAIVFAVSATPALADIEVRFIEGAPKDRFTFTASSTLCGAGPVAIDLNMEGSTGKLVFDVTESGAGVEVFQPLEIVSGSEVLVRASDVTDGDQRLTFDLVSLDPGETFAFTIDVDDTLGAREITVSGSEIAGARVSIQIDGELRSAVLDETARATVKWPSCES